MNSTNETLLFDRFLIMYNLCVFTCIIVVFVFHCTHVRMSYVLNSSPSPYYLCIIFTICRRILGASPPYPQRGSTPGLRWGTFVLRPLICPAPEKKSCGQPCLSLSFFTYLLTYLKTDWLKKKKKTENSKRGKGRRRRTRTRR